MPHSQMENTMAVLGDDRRSLDEESESNATSSVVQMIDALDV